MAKIRGESKGMLMKPPGSLPTRQIGKLGELLVQFMLLRYGVESAYLTTDAGIDLIAYSPTRKRAVKIQVKTNLQPKPGGGKGKMSLDWWCPDDTPADFIAFVDIAGNRIWILTKSELARLAQQHPKGRYHFYLYVGDANEMHGVKSVRAHFLKYGNYLLERRITKIFGGANC